MEYASLRSRDESATDDTISNTFPASDASHDEDNVPVLKHFLVEEAYLKPAKFARRLLSLSTLGHLFVDLALTAPAILFLVFAYLVRHYDGQRMDLDPVPALLKAARYGPTIFPIAFAAVVANCLKSIAAWKLERGISVLSLEYLLGSRTVFGTVTTQLKLRSVSALAPLLVVLWALSPLGGQASLRLLEILPTTTTTSSPIHYLEFKSDLQSGGSVGNSAVVTLPAAVGAFSAALSSPRGVKLASQDIFGNIKVPLLEAFESREAHKDSDGWYDVQKSATVTYASILGLPVKGHSLGTNVTFDLQTSYIYTACTVSSVEKSLLGSISKWSSYMKGSHVSNMTWSNGRTLVISVGHLPVHYHNHAVKLDPMPLELTFTSFTTKGVTNSSCTVATSYIEADIFCHNKNCTAVRVRRSNRSDATPIPTVFDFDFELERPSEWSYLAFFDSFINATDTPWNYKWMTQYISSPLEAYFTEPDDPYTVGANGNGYGDVIWPIGDTIFSHRFSQLINSWWIANIAPFDVTGKFSPIDPRRVFPPSYRFQNVTGTMTPDIIVLHCHRVWLVVLVVASLTMLLAGVLAAILGTLRRGPDLLDHTTSLLRDTPFVNAQSLQSTEDAIEHARKLKNVTVVLGDSQPEQMVGRMAIGTTDAVKAASKLEPARRYC